MVFGQADEPAKDPLAKLQAAAAKENFSDFGHWGHDPKNYKMWGSHSNRLIPIYTFGTKGAGKGSTSRLHGRQQPVSAAGAVKRALRLRAPETVNPSAEYCDQTDIYRIQRAAFDAGKKYVFLVVFDGMDWQTTRAAAIYKSRQGGLRRGPRHGPALSGLHGRRHDPVRIHGHQPPQRGDAMSTSNLQTVKNPGGTMRGGYSAERGGPNPWTPGSDKEYPISQPEGRRAMRMPIPTPPAPRRA